MGVGFVGAVVVVGAAMNGRRRRRLRHACGRAAAVEGLCRLGVWTGHQAEVKGACGFR